MEALPCQAAVRIIGLVMLVCTSGCASPFYHWQGAEGADQQFIVAERGCLLELVALDIREPYDTPFVTNWHNLLVQPCGKSRTEDGLPCWPSEQPLKWLTISQSTLRTLADTMPGYRRYDHLSRFAERALPRHRGLVLIGTDPVVIAFMENASAGTHLYHARELRFVSRANLLECATAVAVFAQDTDVDAVASPRRPAHATIFTLRQPTALREVIDSVADSSKLRQLSVQVVEEGAQE
jgi:hypothetical protein